MRPVWIVIASLALSCKHSPDGPPHEKYELTRAAVRTLPPAVATAFGQAIDELERERTTTVYVSVLADLSTTNAATEWVKAHMKAHPDATASTVFPFYTDGTTPGAEIAVRELTSAFARLVPEGVIRFDKDDDKATGPRLMMSVSVRPTNTFTAPGGRRIYAAIDCTYSATMRVGPARTPLVDGILEPAPDTITIVRRVFEGDKLPQLGADPSILEDSLVYTAMVEKSSAEAIPRLVKAMVP